MTPYLYFLSFAAVSESPESHGHEHIQEQQSEIKTLIIKGKEQGYLTYAEVNDHLPDDIVDPEQIEDIIGMINDMGIEVHEVAPDTETAAAR